MNEQYLIDKIDEIISEIRKEYTKHKEQYLLTHTEHKEQYLLTHIINLEFLMGKYFALMEILLEDNKENPLKPFISTYFIEYEKNRELIEAVTTHIDGMYKKLKEV